MSQNPVITGDGSRTLLNPEVGEHYHSTKDGAFAEALYKHVLPAWEYRIRGRRRVVVLDLCFGLGYNTLTLLWWLRRQGYAGELTVFSPEKDAALLRRLPRFIYPPELADLVPVIAALVSERQYRAPGLVLHLEIIEARRYLDGFSGSFDVVFHDPFSPAVNPALWTRECFAAIRRRAASDLLLTTYSTATAVRLGLAENGFRIYENHPQALVRSATLASLVPLPLAEIDMAGKQERNPAAASLKDRECLCQPSNLSAASVPEKSGLEAGGKCTCLLYDYNV